MGEGRLKRIEKSKEHIPLGGWEKGGSKRIEESKGHIPLGGWKKGGQRETKNVKDTSLKMDVKER
jgi:hypothetical protein